MPRPWTPLLDATHAHAARNTLNEIAAELRSFVESKLQPGAPPIEAEVGEGLSGLAVFFAYLEAAGFFPGARDLASRSMNAAIEALAGQPMMPSLYGGFTGIAWAVQHVSSLLGETAEDFGEIDMAIETYVSRTPWKEDYDLISGLVGLGVYCLERKDSAVARHSLELIVDRLHELAEVSGGEVSWFTSPTLLIDYQKETYPQGYYNAGVAHGIPGVIALLAKICSAGIAREKAAPLLEGAVRWLLAQRLPAPANSSFSAFVAPERPNEDCRLAWCYGDAGIAAALMLAARSTANHAWEQEALAVAHRSVQRDPSTCGVVDVCVCHGSAGLANIFNRLYQATRDPAFADAARYWLQKTLDYRQPGTGAAGYTVYTGNEKKERIIAARYGLIEGIAGVGLAFLSAIAPIEPGWDRIFLMDIPPQ